MKLNQQKTQIQINLSLTKLLEDTQNLAEHFAIAINNKFIPKSLYPATILQEADQIDIIVPQQGG